MGHSYGINTAGVIVESVHFQQTPGKSILRAVVQSSAARIPTCTVQFSVQAHIDQPSALGDPWLAALLLPAMFTGEALEIRAPVTCRLIRTSQKVQDIFASWFPGLLSTIKLVAPQVVPTTVAEDGPTACFFSGGVDSWYSFQKNRGNVSALITVKGFDLPYSDQKIWPEVVHANQDAAAASGVELITVETNLRDYLDPGLQCFTRPYTGSDFWGECYHGSCLNAVGLLLQRRFSRILVPASWQYRRLCPWGSHPLLDCLWSNGLVEFVHDGAEASRLDKIRFLAGVDDALRRLRVCPAYPEGQYNCGRCEKCRRTMLAFRLFGVNEDKLRFAAPLDLRELEMNPPSKYLRPLYREMLDDPACSQDARLMRCLRVLTGDAISPAYEWHRWLSRMRSSFKKRKLTLFGRTRDPGAAGPCR